MPLLPRPDLRSLVPLILAGAWVPAMRSAGAQPPPIDLGGGEIQMELRLPDGDGGFELRTPEENLEFMNLANCTCGEAEEAVFGIQFELVGVTGPIPQSEQVDIYVGTNCASEDVTIRQEQCEAIESFGDVEELRDPRTRGISVRELIATPSNTCPQREDTRTIWALIDVGNDGIDEEEDNSFPLDIETDTRPPPEPANIEASGGEGAIRVTWEAPDGNSDDLWYYQLLCARADGSTDPDDGFPRHARQYVTARDVCGMDDGTTCPRPPGTSTGDDDDDDGGDADAGSGADAGVAFAGGGDAGPDGGTADGATDDGGSGACPDLPGELEVLDESTICAEALSPSATGIRAEGLENGVAYHAVLVVIDRSLNARAIDLGTHTPAEVKDFWEDYKERGGNAEGGCSAGQAGLGGGLLVLVGVALAVRLRRRGRAAGAALLLALALPGAAQAQPWWEGFDDPVQEAEGPAKPNWGLELKVAPYVPDVDSEGGIAIDGRGPFEAMFGDGPFILGALTVDRYLLDVFGQLGVSATVGFMTRSANAFVVDEEGDTVDEDMNGPDRSAGDSNTFRLFPASLGVVYRYTQLDDVLRIPVVPYGRLGLSYYTWWVTGPDGDTAEAPPDCPDVEADCDRALGGSLGWQATAGIAIRAERIDPDAEISLRTELGIEHAGLIFEFTYAKVDGFGADNKMSVGDATFFGGINFEF